MSIFLPMLIAFQDILRSDFNGLFKQKLLVAVSGGCDSMVLCELLRQSGFGFAMAHCNFQLRGSESDADETLVKDYAARHGLEFFSARWDAQRYATDRKISIQEAARELRYAWFFELMHEQGFDVLLTAHHADDNLETFVINLLRGTGTAGLLGIPVRTEKIARPLRSFTREQLRHFAENSGIQWREDASNASTDYLRNHIRHRVLPELRAVKADISTSLLKTQEYLQQTWDMAEDASKIVFKQVVEMHEDQWRIDIGKLSAVSHPNAYLYHWLNRFGFTNWDDVYHLLSAETGKQVLSADYRIVRDRGALLLLRRKSGEAAGIYKIGKGQTVNFPINLQFIEVAAPRVVSNNSIFVDADLLEFPLELRHPQPGDELFPAGMNGQSKKVGKLLRDAKCSPAEKAGVWLLCSAGKIIWVIGYRADERFLPTHQTTNILQIVFTP